jgi:bifunctional NMN adenylyltransferase/nudix hydrolase
MEECGNIEVSGMQYLGSARIDDWRYRKEEDKIMTLLFATDLVYGEAVAHDDLQKVEWFAVDQLERMMHENRIVREHFKLIQLIIQLTTINEKQVITQNF